MTDYKDLKKRFFNRQTIEVEIKKIPRSSLNSFVRHQGKIIGIDQDGKSFWIKLESRKIVKFPWNHFNEIQRYSKNIEIAYNPISFSYLDEIIENCDVENNTEEWEEEREIDGYEEETEYSEDLY